MFARLARQLGVVLLAVSLTAAPVLGGMPRCCKTGAIAGGGNCCCGPQTESDNRPACCRAEPRSCCEQAPVEPEDQPLVASEAPCSCKSLVQQPAIVTGKDRSEAKSEQFTLTAVVYVDGTASQITAATVWQTSQAEPPGVSLHKVHCRWTI